MGVRKHTNFPQLMNAGYPTYKLDKTTRRNVFGYLFIVSINLFRVSPCSLWYVTAKSKSTGCFRKTIGRIFFFFLLLIGWRSIGFFLPLIFPLQVPMGISSSFYTYKTKSCITGVMTLAGSESISGTSPSYGCQTMLSDIPCVPFAYTRVVHKFSERTQDLPRTRKPNKGEYLPFNRKG